MDVETRPTNSQKLYNKAADTRVADNMDVETRPTNSQKLYNKADTRVAN